MKNYPAEAKLGSAGGRIKSWNSASVPIRLKREVLMDSAWKNKKPPGIKARLAEFIMAKLLPPRINRAKPKKDLTPEELERLYPPRYTQKKGEET